MVSVRNDLTIDTWAWDAENQRWNAIGDPLVTGMATIEPVWLSFDASVLVVGTSTQSDGMVKTYDWDASTSTWVSSAADLVSEGTTDYFGQSFAVTPNASAMAVAAFFYPSASTSEGRIYVYDRDRDSGDWILRTTFDGATEGDNLGYSVAISADGNLVAASAPCALDCNGQVRIWKWNTCDGSVDELSSIAGVDSEELGDAVRLSDDGKILAIGSRYSGDLDEGSVKLYWFVAGDWVLLSEPIVGPNAGDRLGWRTLLSGDGSVLTAMAGGRGPGAIYQYDLVPATAPTQQPMRRCDSRSLGLRQGQVFRSDGTTTEVEASIVGSDLVIGDGVNEVIIEGTDGVMTAGDTFTVSGEKFRNPNLWIQSDPVLLGSLDTGTTSEFTFEITIPEDLVAGLHTVQVDDGTVGIAVGVMVESSLPTTSVPPTPTIPAPELPQTGNDARTTLTMAAIAIAVGLVLVRRRIV